MAEARATIHLCDGDKPEVTVLCDNHYALFLTTHCQGPTIIGTPEQLHEIRKAIGRFLFPDWEQPEAAACVEA